MLMDGCGPVIPADVQDLQPLFGQECKLTFASHEIRFFSPLNDPLEPAIAPARVRVACLEVLARAQVGQ